MHSGLTKPTRDAVDKAYFRTEAWVQLRDFLDGGKPSRPRMLDRDRNTMNWIQGVRPRLSLQCVRS